MPGTYKVKFFYSSSFLVKIDCYENTLIYFNFSGKTLLIPLALVSFLFSLPLNIPTLDNSSGKILADYKPPFTPT